MTKNFNGSRVPAVEFLNRGAFIEKMNDHLKIKATSTAVITIDLHRGHVDPSVATLPLPKEKAERIVPATAALLELARTSGMSVIHVILSKRRVEALNPTPHRRAVLATKQSILAEGKGDLLSHNLTGSVQTELHPLLGPVAGDPVIDNKKAFSGFFGTDLDHLLRVLGVDTVLLAGVNTNTCVLSTAFDAYNLGYTTVVVSDCVESMYGEDLHYLALQNISQCVGWVLSLEALSRKVDHKGSPRRD